MMGGSSNRSGEGQVKMGDVDVWMVSQTSQRYELVDKIVYQPRFYHIYSSEDAWILF